MEEQVAQRAGQHPEAYLMDGGFATREAITTLEDRGVSVYAPVRLPHYGDSRQVAVRRERMATEEAKAIYRERGATAEWANAQVRLHGLCQFTVRGVAKVTTVLLLVAIAHDLLRWIALTT